MIKNEYSWRDSEYNDLREYDIKNYLPNNILYKTDRMSMLCSLEARVPFLGNQTVEVARKIPKHFQIDKESQKVILVEAFDDILIDMKIKRQKKHGLTVPGGNWITKEYTIDKFLHLVNKSSISEIINHKGISKIVKEHYMGKFNHNRFLYRLFIVSQWGNKF